MELIAALTKEQFEQLPEAEQGLYTLNEKDGIFQVNVKPATIKVGDKACLFAVEDISGLRNTVNRANQTNHELEKQVKLLQQQYDGINPEEAKEALAKYKEMATWTPSEKVQEQIEAYKKEVAAAHTRELDAVKQDLTKTRTINEQLMELRKQDKFDTEATGILAKHGGKPYLKAAMKELTRFEVNEQGQIQLYVVDAAGNPRYSTQADHQRMTLEELALEWKADNSYATAFEATKAQGSGAGNAIGGKFHGDISKMTPREMMEAGRKK